MSNSDCQVSRLEPRRLLSAITFQPPGYYRAGNPGTGGELVAAGDFNNDGAADLVVAGPDVTPLAVVADWVRVLPGKGDGTFGPPVRSMMLPPNLSAIGTGDFNADGKLDVVVSQDAAEAMVHVLLGNGDGTFGRGGSFHSGSDSRDLAVADFNDDGRLDLVVANASQWAPFGTRIMSQYAAALLPGNGDGTFQREQLIDTDGRPQHFVEAGDVAGEGHTDLVFGQVVIGPGDFAAPESRVWAHIAYLDMSTRPAVTVPAAITGLKVADTNGDGVLDVVASAMRDLMSQGAVAVTIPGNRRSLGGFGDPKLHEAGTAVATDVAVADFNADGRPDLALAGEDPRFDRIAPVPAVITLQNLGGDVLGAATYHPMPEDANYPGRLAAGYFNRDGLPDVALTLPGSNRVGVIVNNSKAIFARPTRLRALPLSFADQPLTRFTVTGDRPGASAFKVLINWGDGSRLGEGTVVANEDGSFTVLGSHTYRRARLYRLGIFISWPDADAVRLVSGLVRVGGGASA
jgi:hypothetical protein